MKKKMSEIDAAALALVARVGHAIASKGNPDDVRMPIDARADSNPYTAELSAYDLARLISYVGGGNADWPRDRTGEQIIWSMVETVHKTVDSKRVDGPGNSVRAARAAWLRYEMDALGIDRPGELIDRLNLDQ